LLLFFLLFTLLLCNLIRLKIRVKVEAFRMRMARLLVVGVKFAFGLLPSLFRLGFGVVDSLFFRR